MLNNYMLITSTSLSILMCTSFSSVHGRYTCYGTGQADLKVICFKPGEVETLRERKTARKGDLLVKKWSTLILRATLCI